jgi:hypothetical protein
MQNRESRILTHKNENHHHRPSSPTLIRTPRTFRAGNMVGVGETPPAITHVSLAQTYPSLGLPHIPGIESVGPQSVSVGPYFWIDRSWVLRMERRPTEAGRIGPEERKGLNRYSISNCNRTKSQVNKSDAYRRRIECVSQRYPHNLRVIYLAVDGRTSGISAAQIAFIVRVKHKGPA